ncbi:DUF58 domain-containing protein [Telmatocola sphagniphila]|uniref:DUF58 domain-containing protein n=1 Tax=Telmatocola sphagniphila TaxID=1123043 RepID=A0A8E6EWH5_9BACT|nr:DUF58 domain-containing protein [Telmatocola sphagniphila]QVL30146.1 DUF58 domain-containing protein [Telmatocola sphagniphila]
MPKLLQPDILARAEALGLSARNIVEGLRVGDHKSPYRGFSVEFVQHREYVPGDDIRHIDWKSYGRSERYTIKQYEQETNFLGHILLDGSKSMLYGEGEQNKLEYGKLLAASIAYLILKQRDSASLNIFDSKWRAQLPPSSNMYHLNAILHTLESAKPQEKSSTGPLLEEIAERLRRRGLVFLMSDVFDDIEPFMKGLKHLRFLGHDVTLFHIVHPDEVSFPFTGNVKFEGLEEIEEYKTRPHLIREAYLRVFGSYLEELQRNCEMYRVDYVRCDTSKPVKNVLAEYLIRRLQQGRK